MARVCQKECTGEFCINTGERYPVCVDFSATDALPDGESLVSGVVTATNTTDDTDATTIVLDSPATVTIQGDTARFVVMHGGTSGKRYDIELVVTTTTGYTFKDTLCMEAL